MKEGFLVPLLICFGPDLLTAQVASEIFAGHQALANSMLIFSDIENAGKVSFFNLTFFQVDHNDQENNTYEIYQTATFNLNPTWGIAGGGRFLDDQFIPLLALSYQIAKDHFYFNLFPAAQFNTQSNQMEYSLFGILFLTPRINERWKLFSQLAFEPLFNMEEHIYSYQQIRIGLEYKNLIQFGLGANIDQSGNQFTFNQNYGIFIRKELK